MNQTNNTKSIFGIRLTGFRNILIRFVLSTLVGGPRLWISFVVAMPLILLFATVVHDSFIPLAAGAPVALCLWFLWLSHEFINPTLSVDTDSRELVLAKPYGNGEYSPIAVDDLDRISIIRLANAAMVRLHYTGEAMFKPLSTAVTVSSVPDLVLQLERMDVDVTVQQHDWHTLSIDMKHLRVVGTPLVLGGTVVAIWYLYGTNAFLTDVAIVPAIVLIGFSIYGLVWQLRLD